jgi:putative ABC transport system permease protein
MIEFALKNIERQKVRTLLTALGIMVGIASVVTLSSFAEGINTFVQSSLQLSSGKIMVQQVGSGGFMTGFSGSDITTDQVNSLLGVDGVEDVVPINIYIASGAGFAPDLVVIGIDPTKGEYFTGPSVGMYSGRGFDETSGESGIMVIGRDLSEKKNLNVGDFIKVKNKDFEIVGVMERINNANIDGSAMVHIEDLQDALGVETYQFVYVIPADIRQVEAIADNIKNMDETLSASTSKDIARQSSQTVDQLRVFTFGLGAIAAVVGGLGVLNTMIMSVIERRKEIGVMKAIGATKKSIIVQIISESSMISVIGGLVGIGIGFIGAAGLTALTNGSIPATVTPQLAFVGIVFSLTLGAIGGVYPAIKASNLDPVEALRYE